jgi:hypothetical protein
MCITMEDAAVIAITWPENMTRERRIALMLQLRRIELPSNILEQWLKESSRK